MTDNAMKDVFVELARKHGLAVLIDDCPQWKKPLRDFFNDVIESCVKEIERADNEAERAYWQGLVDQRIELDAVFCAKLLRVALLTENDEHTLT
jgi:hypothetical protein